MRAYLATSFPSGWNHPQAEGTGRDLGLGLGLEMAKGFGLAATRSKKVRLGMKEREFKQKSTAWRYSVIEGMIRQNQNNPLKKEEKNEILKYCKSKTYNNNEKKIKN
jgi:hypothetical protein